MESYNPRSVTSADFNRDGIQDLASAGFNGDLSVLLGTGTGSFGAATSFAAGNNPSSVTSADFDGDAIPDLASTYLTDRGISILLGNGTGSFGVAANFGVGDYPSSVTSADFNGDGIQDLATANIESDNLSVLLGDGTGSFGAAPGSPFAAGTQPVEATSADFNGDGIRDLASANNGSGNLSVLLGVGTGSFGAAPGSPFAAGTGPASVTSADFNGDGIQDLASANGASDNLSVLIGDGTGSFGAAPGSPFAAVTGPNSVTSADFNGDGVRDLASADAGSDNLSVLINSPTADPRSANLDFAATPQGSASPPRPRRSPTTARHRARQPASRPPEQTPATFSPETIPAASRSAPVKAAR